MKLGPLQEMWLESLEKHPERQTTNQLGVKSTNGSYKACCLGELHICYHRMKHKKLPFDNNYVRDIKGGIGDTIMLSNSFEKYGLKSERGHLKRDYTLNGSVFRSLAEMNDIGISWPDIAKFVRENPDMVFNKSV